VDDDDGVLHMSSMDDEDGVLHTWGGAEVGGGGGGVHGGGIRRRMWQRPTLASMPTGLSGGGRCGRKGR
jgi:hypothetical protein